MWDFFLDCMRVPFVLGRACECAFVRACFRTMYLVLTPFPASRTELHGGSRHWLGGHGRWREHWRGRGWAERALGLGACALFKTRGLWTFVFHHENERTDYFVTLASLKAAQDV